MFEIKMKEVVFNIVNELAAKVFMYQFLPG